MKSCLRCGNSSLPPNSLQRPRPSSSPPIRPKCVHRVSFRDKRDDEVHTADDWDRTPVEVARKLSYEDILELKEMQVAAARACARATAASGMTPKYLSNVPLGLLPLLPPETNNGNGTMSPSSLTASPSMSPRSFSPPPIDGLSGSSSSSVLGMDNGKRPGGVSLAEACLCRVFSADTGLPATKDHGLRQQQSGPSGSNPSPSSPPGGDSRRQPTTYMSQPHQFKLVNGVHQTPSPPDTPPRLSVTSIPPPPPTSKARHFAFLPLLDASTSSSPVVSASPSPNTSGMSSPVSPRGVGSSPVPPMSLSASLSALHPGITSPPSSSSSSSASSSLSSMPSPGAYTAYDPYGGSLGIGGNATLGLERRLEYKFESDSDSQSTSSEDEEDKNWPRDWPGRHAHAHTHSNSQLSSPSRSNHSPHTSGHPHNDVKNDSKDKRPVPSSSSSSSSSSKAPRLPPSPPADTRPLPASPNFNSLSTRNNSSSPRRSNSNSSSGSRSPSSASASPREGVSPSRHSSPSPSRVRGLHTSSPSPPPSSPSRARKSKMALPLVTLA